VRIRHHGAIISCAVDTERVDRDIAARRAQLDDDAIGILFQRVTGFGSYAAMGDACMPRLFSWIVPHDFVQGRGVTSSMVGGWKFVEKGHGTKL